MTIIDNENIQEITNKTIKELKKVEKSKQVKTILGHSIVRIELVSEEDPYASLKKYMREDDWYWDYNHDY